MLAQRPEAEDRDWQRLDKWLWCARFMKARAEGMVRLNRQPTDKPHARLRVSDVITLPLRGRVLVVQVLALAARRGPASEARLLYREIAEQSAAAGPTSPCGDVETAPYRPPLSPIPTRSPR
jgi:ribosome-associated heat shock protein Hsp15